MKKPLSIALVTIGVIALAAATFYLVSQRLQTRGDTAPTFSFNSEGLPGWETSGNINSRATATDEYQGDVATLPIASMTVHEGTGNIPGSCFVMYFYQDTPLDANASIESLRPDAKNGSNSYTVNELAVKQFTMQTPEGEKTLDLHQYEITGEGSDSMASGEQFGVVRLTDGYIEVRSYCETAEYLDRTLSVFEAVTLNL